MGNDGGSIPKRRELVKEAAKALTSAQLKETQTEAQEYAWTTDPLSRKPLARPVVSDAAGVLYNKDSIIEYLLKPEDDPEKSEMRKMGGVKGAGEDGAGGFVELGMFGDRVKGLKDVVEIQFEVAEEQGRGGRGEKWVCPVTGTGLGPGAKAVYVVPCGHAFAGSVVKEVAESVCLTCNAPFAENDVIPILSTLPTDLARLNLRLKTLREKNLTHALKKAQGSKKRKKTASADKETNGEDGLENGTTSKQQPSSDEGKNKKEKEHKAPSASSNGIKNASTASLTRKVLEEQELMNKKRKLAQNENVSSLFNKTDNKPKLGNSADYMTRGFTIGRK